MNLTIRDATLPTELRSVVSGFCPIDALTSLALVSKEFQIYAEKRLYASVAIMVFTQKTGALETLAKSPLKAKYVQFLSVEFYQFEGLTGLDAAVMENLLLAAPSMRNLKDLRIRLRPQVVERYIHSLDDIICAGHFQLTTIFLNGYHDIARITSIQMDLKVVGVFNRVDLPTSLLLSLEQRSIILLCLDKLSLPPWHHITLFPNLLSLEQAQNLPSILNQSFQSHPLISANPLDAKDIRTVEAYVWGELSHDIFLAFIDSISELFPLLCELDLRLNLFDRMLDEWKREPVKWPRVSVLEVCSWDIGLENPNDSSKGFSGNTKEFLEFLRHGAN
ncbi:hypothetical protein DFP72DRAFT_1076117 [Ephemerocybe angulata]|uniref:F-box domain-containing protein n=1 Tax=Ephemerocybe angulata TaxID=980116 RepID=A0A8H6HJC4_9AGAR|nr:hypothetical protein DFP72DRAFT_1076117 [Tulosesus angulatus]